MGYWFRALGLVLVLVVAVLSAWVGSSLASWLGGPRWLAVATALALLPGLALAWERGAVGRRRARKKPRKVSLPVTLALRSLLLGAVFLGLLLSWWPNQTFLALAQRGDWFLDGASPSWDPLRPVARSGAEVLERLWRATAADPYQQWKGAAPVIDGVPQAAAVARAPVELPMPLGQPVRRGWAADAGVAPEPIAAVDGGSGPALLCAVMEDGSKVCVEEQEPPEYRPAPKPLPSEPPHPQVLAVVVPPQQQRVPEGGAATGAKWPLPDVPHPAVARMDSLDTQSISSLGAALQRHTMPGADRLKAVHDWIAVNVAYDAAAYQAGKYPGQQAPEVLARRTAVCAGYARLFEALAKEAGEEAVYLTGPARGYRGLESHAWNAAKLGDGWALFDVTWNAGGVQEVNGTLAFVPRYRTMYLFTPPDVFADSHFPDDARWQLLAEPRSAAAALARPRLMSGYYSAGLTLKKPNGAVTEVPRGVYEVELDNPLRRSVMASACHASRCQNCEGGGRGAERLRCLLDAGGQWQLKLFAASGDEEMVHAEVASATLQVR